MTDAPDQPADPGSAPPDGVRAHIPNALTILRLVLAAVFVGLLTRGRAPVVAADAGFVDRIGALGETPTLLLLVAASVFIIAAITDALDGYLARKWNAVSRFGRVMDPLADKVLVLGAFVLLAGPAFAIARPDGSTWQISGIAGWMAVVIIARELLVTSIRGVYEAQGVDFSAGPAGKAKMVLQSVAVPVILLLVVFAAPHPGSAARGVILTLAWATTIATVLSGIPYVLKAVAVTAAPAAAAAATDEPIAAVPNGDSFSGPPAEPKPARVRKKTASKKKPAPSKKTTLGRSLSRDTDEPDQPQPKPDEPTS